MANQRDEFRKQHIVISGISGAFPQSENMEEFKENLFSGKDLTAVTTRWGSDFPDVPRKIGGLKELDKFDNTFFRIYHKIAQGMSISARMLLEKTFEAIVDAGYNPNQLKGKNIGVFYAAVNMDSDLNTDIGTGEVNELTELGKVRALTPNRISYWLDIHGPSMFIDTACSASMTALDAGYQAIQSGACDAAIVCTANVGLSPHTSRCFLGLGVLDPNGCSRPFDAEADGFVRAEGVVAVFLQKMEDARRVYANLLNTKVNCDGYTPDGITHPSGKMQEELFKEFYNEIDISPLGVSYVEAHGTGTQVGDVEEVGAVENFFCKNRSSPLKIGSLKSNMGHAEASSGLCSVAKMIIAFETGMIPPNINLNTLNPKIQGLHNGTIEVVTKPTPCDGEFYAVNSFGVGGSNAHILLSPYKKLKKIYSDTNDELPRLVAVSGRTEEAVNVITDDLEKNYKDVEYIRLMHEVFSEDINGHNYRGYVILQQVDEHNERKKHQKFFSGEKRPIWFIFSGMGSQWPTMGKSLMKIPIFAESIRKSHEILQRKGVNLMKIITEDDPQIFHNILNSFVGIAAIQIALVDILKAIDVQPDGIIGHSVGELGCAYADGCFTAEQMILASYYRGLVSLETEFIHGTMAAVGASYDVAKHWIPPEIDIACHNGSSSCTISGPTDAVRVFMKQLQEKKIFVREVNVSNIPYHSRYISCAGLKLVSYLKKIIPYPKLRSNKWICTSATENEWGKDETKYSSAQYHANNLLNPVYFEESSRLIPDNAITIEISPHGLLQPILRRSLPPTVDNIPLTLRSHENGAEFLLNALGRLYEVGITPKLSNLYPPVQFPVSRSTPMISPLIKWQHEEEWPITTFVNKNTVSGERDVTINPQRDSYQYLRGHVVDGRNLYPAFGYLVLAWEGVAIMQQKVMNKVSVVFENVRFERAANLPTEGYISFHISIQKDTGNFVITENNAVLVTGTVRVPEDINEEKVHVLPFDDNVSNSSKLPLNTKDFYKELKLRGYYYQGLFKKVVYCNSTGTYGKTLWCDNFVSFMDTLAQITLLNVDTRELIIPTAIRKIVIDVDQHFSILNTLDKEKPEFPVNYYPNLTLASSGGIQLIGVKGTSIPRKRDPSNVILENYQFVPFISDERMNFDTVIRICVNIAIENLIASSLKFRSLEILDQSYNTGIQLISTIAAKAISEYPLMQESINVYTNTVSKSTAGNDNIITVNGNDVTMLSGELPNDKNFYLIILSNIQDEKKVNNIFTFLDKTILDAEDLAKIFNALRDDGFIIAIESTKRNIDFGMLGLNVCFSRVADADKKVFMLRKIIQSIPVAGVIQIRNTTYSWIPEIQKTLSSIKNKEEKLILYAEKEPLSGILGFFNCLRRDEDGRKTRCFFLMDEDIPEFSLQNPFYKSQFDKDLSHNVYKNGQWGSYRFLLLDSNREVDVFHAYGDMNTRGDLSTLKWIEGPLNPKTYKPQNELIHVYYSSINFRDVMLASGKISHMDFPLYSRLMECFIGLEFAGKDINGTRVTGMLPFTAFSSLVKPRWSTWVIPDHMTLEEAATIPLAYATVIFAFTRTIRLKRGSSVLIHAGAGGVGQAAINICLHYNCDIFVTVGTPDKVEFIKRTFPQIPESNIGRSRDTSFEQLVMERTNGRGVDVVLNSLAEEKLRASVRCTAPHGHFLEIGKYDMSKNNSLELGHFLQAVHFHSVQMDFLFMHENEELISLHQTIQDMLDNGIIKPLRRTVFSKDKLESAFRYIAAGKHIGKVVIKIREEEQNIRAKPVPILMKAQPRVMCQEDKSYVIIGGLGGFGIELTDWLVIRGARKIVLSSRNGIKTGYQSHKINLWRSYGVNVVVCTEDITTEIGVEKVLRKANSLGPVVAIFNLAVVLIDGQFYQQTPETFAASAGSKVLATTHLDELSRRECPHLEHFVVFSSVSCGRGNTEQTNYGMSNSIIERICEARHADNLPALAVQWGAVGDVGAVAEFDEDNFAISIGGSFQQKITSCLQKLDLFMRQQKPIVSSIIIAEKFHADTDIVLSVAHVLGIKDLNSISLSWTLPELGMDSIMSLELRQLIESEFSIYLSPQELKNITFGKLYAMKKEKMATGETNPSDHVNENVTNAPILRIPFIGNSNQDNFVPGNSTVFILPGIEGSSKFMVPLAKNLPDLQAFCFQYFLKSSDKSFKQHCEYFTQLLTEKLGPDQEFCLITFSLGTVFGMEIMRNLEKQGRRGYVWFIDGSPDYLMEAMKTKSPKGSLTNEEVIQCFACIHVIKVLLPERWYDEFPDHLQNSAGWESKKKFCAKQFPNETWNESSIYEFLDKVYSFVSELWTATTTSAEPLETPCTLIRCIDNIYNLDECYGLSKHFKRPVDIHKIKTDHVAILEQKEVADIIMKNPIWKKS